MTSNKVTTAHRAPATSSPTARHGRSRLDLLDYLVVGVIATTPVSRFLAAQLSSQTFWLIVVVLLACVGLKRTSRPFAAPAWVLTLPLVLIAGVLSGLDSDLGTSVTVAVQLAVIVSATPFVIHHYATHRKRVLVVGIRMAIAVQTVSSIVGILQSTLGVEVLGYVARAGRANGLADHPNTLALMCVLAILVVSEALVRRETNAWLLVSVLLVNVWALFASGSLSNLIALGVGGILLLFAHRAFLKAVALSALGALLLAACAVFLGWRLDALFSGVEERVDNVTGELGNVGSLEVRRQTWASAWDRIQQDPLLGAGMDPTNAAVFGETVTHNYILQLWYRGGLSLLLVALIVTGIALALAFKAIALKNSALAAAIVAATLTFAYTAAFFTQPYYWMPLLIAAGCATTTHASSSPRHSSSVFEPKRRASASKGR